MKDWEKTADKKTIEKVLSRLKDANFNVLFFESGKEAKKKVLQLIPKGTRVLTNQSQTLQQIGLAESLEDSSKYVSVRKEYLTLDREKDMSKIRKLRSTPEVIVGSVQAVTEDGEIVVASNSGSQLAAYVYSADKVIWVIGTQKIVKDFKQAKKRVYEYALPLESNRLKKLYGIPSNVSKLLIYNREPAIGRVTIIMVNESLGF